MGCRYPLMLDVTDRLVVIVGGGAVASRKAASLLAAGATRVRAVAPQICQAMPPIVQCTAEPFDPRHLDGAELVFAATSDPAVNDQVVAEARSRRILVSRIDADDDSAGDFISPAVFREGRITVAVAAESPALAVMVRNTLAQGWQDGWAKMAEAMHTLRPSIKQNSRLTRAKRREIFHELATPQAISILHDGGLGALRAWLSERYPELANHASGA